jgi:aspartyl-tRNA(Asn)/glutamyl-tRNA(Gln) amidotransferase subunit A
MGPDPLDPTTDGAPLWDAEASKRAPRTMTIGIPKSFYVDDLEADVDKALDEAIATFRKLGARIVQVELPDQTLVSAAALIVIGVEALTIHAPWLRRRAGDYSEQVRNRLMNGAAYSGVEYLEALRWRGPALAAHLEAISQCDAILVPAVRVAAPTIAETDVGGGPNADAVILGITRFMRAVNYLGLPSLGVPAGFSKGGLPIGLQLIGRPFRDEALVALGTAFQDATDYHARAPRL